jgi:5-methylcytosine-specific restriction protein A
MRMMKIEDLQQGIVLTNNQVKEIFQCGNMGGMRRSHATNTLVLICDHTKSLYNAENHNHMIGNLSK